MNMWKSLSVVLCLFIASTSYGGWAKDLRKKLEKQFKKEFNKNSAPAPAPAPAPKPVQRSVEAPSPPPPAPVAVSPVVVETPAAAPSPSIDPQPITKKMNPKSAAVKKGGGEKGKSGKNSGKSGKGDIKPKNDNQSAPEIAFEDSASPVPAVDQEGVFLNDAGFLGADSIFQQ